MGGHEWREGVWSGARDNYCLAKRVEEGEGGRLRRCCLPPSSELAVGSRPGAVRRLSFDLTPSWKETAGC